MNYNYKRKETEENQQELRQARRFLQSISGTFYANQANFGYRTALEKEDRKIS